MVNRNKTETSGQGNKVISLGNGQNPEKIRTTSKQTRVHMQSLQHQVKEQHLVISMRMLTSHEKVN